MKQAMMFLLIGIFIVGIGAFGFFLFFGGFHHMIPLSTPAWGMHHHMDSMHGQDSMMQGWMQSLHNVCMSWMEDATAEQEQQDVSKNPERPDESSERSLKEQVESENSPVFELQTTIQGGFAYQGLNDSIQNQVNPALRVRKGQQVMIEVVNGDGVPHDLVIPALGRRTKLLSRRGARATLRFTPDQEGTYAYYCSVPGHRAAGMEGRIVVEG